MYFEFKSPFQNLMYWVKATAKFLEIERSEAFYQAVAHQCTFRNIKAKKQGLVPEWSLLKGLTVYRSGKITCIFTAMYSPA